MRWVFHKVPIYFQGVPLVLQEFPIAWALRASERDLTKNAIEAAVTSFRLPVEIKSGYNRFTLFSAKTRPRRSQRKVTRRA